MCLKLLHSLCICNELDSSVVKALMCIVQFSLRAYFFKETYLKF